MKKLTISLLSTLGGAVAAAAAVKKVTGEATEVQHNLSEKHLALFLMMNQWVAVKQEGKNLAEATIGNSALLYGYASLEDLESRL